MAGTARPSYWKKAGRAWRLYTTGPTQARRCVDCLCFTTDAAYHPYGREKPDFAAWKPLRQWQQAGLPDVEPLVKAKPARDVPPAWKIADGAPAFLWNVGTPWLDELKKPLPERLDSPFSVDPPLLKDFLAAFKGQSPPVYSHPLSGPVVHIPLYPDVFRPNSPFTDWLTRHPQQKFAILLNYGDPTFPKDTSPADRKALYAQLQRFGKQFVGFIAGENLAYANVDTESHERENPPCAHKKRGTGRTARLQLPCHTPEIRRLLGHSAERSRSLGTGDLLPVGEQ